MYKDNVDYIHPDFKYIVVKKLKKEYIEKAVEDIQNAEQKGLHSIIPPPACGRGWGGQSAPEQSISHPSKIKGEI